jgi:uncharacterized membrane protein HdeD (DUF308 family)
MWPIDTLSIQRHWILHLFEGMILIALGLLAFVVPPGIGLALFGWLFLIGGTTGLITTLVMWRAPGFWWSLVSAAFTIAAGGALFMLPELGLVTLPPLLIAFLILEGLATIMFALDHRRELSGRWGWVLASGIVDLLLACVILIGLPATYTWAIGLIVGVNLLSGGAALIGLALAARSRSGATHA